MSKGFTIVELVIAIFILSVAVFGVYNAFSTIVVLTSGASNRLTAAYLAQEGIEIIRNIRDTNWLNMVNNPDATWVDGLGSCASGCQADYRTYGTALSPLAPYGAGGSYLNIDANGFYVYDTGIDTKFKRKITITFVEGPDSPPYIMRVSVKVFWSEKGEWSQIEAEDNLYDWY